MIKKFVSGKSALRERPGIKVTVYVESIFKRPFTTSTFSVSFLLSDEMMSLDHIKNDLYEYPKCNDEGLFRRQLPNLSFGRVNQHFVRVLVRSFREQLRAFD